jgi:hypothetical protein
MVRVRPESTSQKDILSHFPKTKQRGVGLWLLLHVSIAKRQPSRERSGFPVAWHGESIQRASRKRSCLDGCTCSGSTVHSTYKI